jgi:SAM-dependent methyltransferase
MTTSTPAPDISTTSAGATTGADPGASAPAGPIATDSPAPTTVTPATPATPRPVDMDTLMSFVFRAVDEVGSTLNTALVVMGDRLGYYRAMASGEPTTPARLAEDTDTSEHYAREWLSAQAAGGYVDYDPESGHYTLPPEQAVALADESSPAFVIGMFQIALGTVIDSPRIFEAARQDDGFGWHQHNSNVHVGCERFFRPSYNAHLTTEWIPALEGVAEKLQRGASIADIGCGHGASSIVMGHAYPQSRVSGSDYHPASISVARQRAEAAGLADRVTFEVAPAQSFSGEGFDLVTMFDCLHDMGDPVGAAKYLRQHIAPDGTWMIVEPHAGDHVEDNLNPVGRAYYGFSTLLCTPASLSQDVGLALGTQAGPARIRDVVTTAGFTRFRQVAETPFNNVYEVRP